MDNVAKYDTKNLLYLPPPLSLLVPICLYFLSFSLADLKPISTNDQQAVRESPGATTRGCC